MFGNRNKKRRYKNIDEVYAKVKRKLALVKGKRDPNLPSVELREQIARELQESRQEEESINKQKILKEEKVIKPSEDKHLSYGDYTPPTLYTKLSHRKKLERVQHGKISKNKILPIGSTPLDYLLHLPTVLRRLMLDLREPIPILDKMLFFVVFLIAYFITVIIMVAHYKFIKPDINYVVQIDNQYVELIVKRDDIPALRQSLGSDWLQKLGKIQIKNTRPMNISKQRKESTK